MVGGIKGPTFWEAGSGHKMAGGVGWFAREESGHANCKADALTPLNALLSATGWGVVQLFKLKARPIPAATSIKEKGLHAIRFDNFLVKTTRARKTIDRRTLT